MTALKLNWGEDLVVNQNGGLVTEDGEDEVVSRIARRILTNSKTILSGEIIPPDYIFHPQYGLSFRAFVQGKFTDDQKAKIRQVTEQGIKMDAAVDPSLFPVITFSQPRPDILKVQADFWLLDGTKSAIKFSIGNQEQQQSGT